MKNIETNIDLLYFQKNESSKKLELPLRVSTYDIDIAGHVNNIVYLRWIEDMRSQLFSGSYPLKDLLESGYYLVVVSCEMQYKKAVKLFDNPYGEMTMHCCKHGIFIFSAEIKTADVTVFSATQKCVLIRLEDNKMYKGDICSLLKSNTVLVS